MNHSPRHWKEARRLQAWELLPHGWSQRQIAEAMGVSEGAISPWMTRAREGGPDALRHRPSPGAPRRLSADQLAGLPVLLHRDADADGFRGQVWTRARVAVVMHLACGVWYHPSPVSRRLQALRWSPQQPTRRARQRDEAAIARWRQETWPALKRGHKPNSHASASSMKRGSPPGPGWSAPLPPWGTRRSCGSGGPALISRPSAPCPPRASCMSLARTAPSTLRQWSGASHTCGARWPGAW
jgi:transposase